MIPQTVPNRPTNGAVAPTVARNVMKRSIRSISRPTVTFMTRSMRCCRLARITAVPRRPLAALRRHSRIAAAKTALIGSCGRWPTRSNRSSSEPPDQKVSSKLDAACCNRRRRSDLSKMTAHDQKEASSSSSIVSLTMLSDCRNSSKIERCWGTVPGSAVASKDCIDGGLLWRLLDNRWIYEGRWHERGAQRRWQPARPAVAPDAGDQHVERDDGLVAAADLLVERQGCRADFDDPGINAQRVVEPRRGAVIRRAASHGEKDAGLLGDPAVREAELAHHLGAAALGEFEVVRVIDDARRIGVLVIDPQRHRMRHAGCRPGIAHPTAPLSLQRRVKSTGIGAFIRLPGESRDPFFSCR